MRSDRLEVILDRDPRYPPEAYEFIFNALNWTQRQLRKKQPAGEAANARHVSARELCEGAAEYALEEFGMLAPTVLRLWNVEKTDDFGALVYNLIEAGEMSQSDEDRRENFNGLFDLEATLKEGFVLVLEE